MSDSQTQQVPIGNWTQYIKNALTGKNNFIKFLIGKSGGGLDDPTESDCNKSFNASYQCGNGTTKLINIEKDARGQTVVFDCTKESEICNGVRLTIGDDGNLVMSNSNGEQIWTSNTNKTGIPLDKYKAVNSKYKRNYLKSGEILQLGEFIGSPSGNCYLQMVKKQNGNAGLELRYEVTECSESDGKSDSKYSNLLYSVPKVNTQSLTKVGYVDNDSNLHEYPNDMVSYGNNYYLMGNYTNKGNDINTIENSTMEQCREKCNTNDNCAGFVFNNIDKTCKTKSSGMFPLSNRVPDKNSELYVRSKSVANNASCTKAVNSSTSMEWELYPANVKMSPDTLCNLGLIVKDEKQFLDAANKDLRELSNTLEDKIKKLSKEDKKLVSDLGYNVDKLKNDLNEYNNVYKVAENKNNEFDRAIAMYEDTNLDMISENYQYLLWTILAIIIIIGSIRITK